MCNDDWTVTDWYIPTDTMAEGEGGRAVQTLKSVIDVICSSQTSGFVPREEETSADAFTSQPGCPLGTAPYSWKQLDRNRFLPREKGHASVSACLGSYYNLEQCASFIRGLCLVLPCEQQQPCCFKIQS